MNEKISVIITTKNRLGYLKEALNSVINQTYKNKEIIVINDGSEDDTKKWLDSLENKNNFNIIHNKTSKGANYCRNLGIKKSTGDYIATMDDDDIWAMHKLEKQMEIFNNNKNIDIVSCSYTLIDKNSKIIKDFFKSEKFYDSKEAIKKLILDSNFIGGFSFPIIKKKIISENNIFLDENIKSSQDVAFYLELLKFGAKLYIINKPLVLYRIHDLGQITNDINKLIDGSNSILKYMIDNKYNEIFIEEFKKNRFKLIALMAEDKKTYINYKKKYFNLFNNTKDKKNFYFFIIRGKLKNIFRGLYYKFYSFLNNRLGGKAK
jgi:glycosyltransferase involved in cell wall biosynthesis